MKTWFDGKPMEMYVGQVVTVYRCGDDRKEYGEFATLTRATKRYLVFTTDSGATVKTRRDCALERPKSKATVFPQNLWTPFRS